MWGVYVENSPFTQFTLGCMFLTGRKRPLRCKFFLVLWAPRCRGGSAELYLPVGTSQPHPAWGRMLPALIPVGRHCSTPPPVAGYWWGTATDSTPAWSLPAAHPSRQHSATDAASTAPCTASANFPYFYRSLPPRPAGLGFWLSCTCCLIYTNAATSGLCYHLQFRHPQSKELIQQGWSLLSWAIST